MPAGVQGLQEEQTLYYAVCASVSSLAAPSWAAQDGHQRHLQHKSSSGTHSQHQVQEKAPWVQAD